MPNLLTAAIQPVSDDSVWTGADFANERSWLRTLSATQVQALLTFAQICSGRSFLSLSAAEAKQGLAALLPLVEGAKTDLVTRGFVVLRGVPVEALPPESIKVVYWAIGLLFGQGLTQNAKADFLCPITDMGVDFGYAGSASQQNVRGYQSKADLNYHCDPTDVVALLCVRKAQLGGKSSIVSTSAIHNLILRDHPEHLPTLYRGFIYDRKAEQWPSEPSTSGRIPVFSKRNEQVSCRFARSYILDAAVKSVPLTRAEKAALDCFDEVAKREEMPLRMDFEPGDIQLLNNYKVVHGRTAYEDHADPEKRRFLWRLWLNLGDEAPWNQEDEVMRWAFARFGNLGRSVEEWKALQANVETSII